MAIPDLMPDLHHAPPPALIDKIRSGDLSQRTLFEFLLAASAGGFFL
jgi:hypothetical protein